LILTPLPQNSSRTISIGRTKSAALELEIFR
jgi:hypothetical protein